MNVMMSRRALASQFSQASVRRAPTTSAAAPRSTARPVVERRRVHRMAAQPTSEANAAVDGAGEASPSSTSEDPADIMDRVRAAMAAEGGSSDDVPDQESIVASLESEVQSLRESAAEAAVKAAALTASVASGKDQLLRLNADFDNFRRRTTQQNALLADSTRGDVVKQLLPIVDGFEQARTQVKAETEGEIKINNSYQGLYKQMVDLMRSLGVEPVPTVGTPFDPELHEAIMREASDEHPDGTVLVEFRKGFRLGDKLLRPAMVQVSFRDDAPVASAGSSADE